MSDLNLHVNGLLKFQATHKLPLMRAWSIYFQGETNTDIARNVLSILA